MGRKWQVKGRVFDIMVVKPLDSWLLLIDVVSGDVRQTPVQHKALEDVHGLFQLPADRCHHR